jgi:hypothetical protein
MGVHGTRNHYIDGTHLWPSGYQIVADGVTQAIQQLLATPRKTAELAPPHKKQ